MSGLFGAENVSAFERAALSAVKDIPAGHGLTLARLPIGSAWADSAFVCRPAAKGEIPFAVVSHRAGSLSPAATGKLVLCSAPFFQVRMVSAGKKDETIAIVDGDGRWGVSTTAVARLAEDCAAGELAWATRLTV